MWLILEEHGPQVFAFQFSFMKSLQFSAYRSFFSIAKSNPTYLEAWIHGSVLLFFLFGDFCVGVLHKWDYSFFIFILYPVSLHDRIPVPIALCGELFPPLTIYMGRTSTTHIMWLIPFLFEAVTANLSSIKVTILDILALFQTLEVKSLISLHLLRWSCGFPFVTIM